MSEMNKQQLIEDNTRLVYFIVSREYPTYLRDEDVIQSGMLGLCKAAETWDENKAKFSTYAGRCIRNEINQEFIRRKPHSKVLSLNATTIEDGTLEDIVVGDTDVEYIDDSFYLQLNMDEQYIFKMYNDGFSPSEIAESLDCNVQKIQKILRIIKLKWRDYNAN